MLWQGSDLGTIAKGGLGNLPNGISKSTLGLFDEIDENTAELTYFAENYYYINNFNGNNF
jgi:hypothetical protein